MNKTRIRLLFVVVLFAAGCSKQKQNGRLLATAGGVDLYMGDVAAHVDTNSAYAVRNYVSKWVDEQLLYNEAASEGLDNSSDFKERVGEFSRQLAITDLLNRKVYGSPVEFTQEEISTFYTQHRIEFKAAEDLAQVNLAGFDKRSYAVSFRNSLVSGAQWSSVFSEIPQYAILSERDSVFITSSSVSPAIWNVVQSLENGRISFPIQVDSLSCIVQVIQKIEPGTPLPLEYVTQLIKERLTVFKRRQMTQDLINSLRSSGNYQIDPSVAIKDTSAEE